MVVVVVVVVVVAGIPLWDAILPNPCIEKSFNLACNSVASNVSESTSSATPEIFEKNFPSFSV